MNFSKLTKKVLESLKEIVPSIVFNEDQKGYLLTNNESKQIGIRYTLSEEEKKMPEFSIFDFPGFCSILSEFDDSAVLTFKKENSLIIRSGASQLEYYFASKEFIPERPKKFLEDSDFVNLGIEFILKKEDHQKISKFMKMLKSDAFAIESKAGQIIISLRDLKNDQSTKFKLVAGKNLIVDAPEGLVYNFQVADIKFPVDFDYNVKIMKDPKICKLSAQVDKEEKDEKSEKKQLVKIPIGLEYIIGAITD